VWKKCRPDIAVIRAKSGKRVAANDDFIEIETENKKAVERQGKTVQPLNIEEMRKERELAKQSKETKGKYSHGLTASDKKPSQSPLTEAERRELWIKEVSGDAYVHESIEVLDDVLAADPTCAAVN
jgi:hypothetical protein